MVKKSKAPKHYNHIVDTICPICGKNFIPAPMHIYNDGKKVVCSWTCHCEAARRREAAKKPHGNHFRGKPIPPGRNREIVRLYYSGTSVKELAVKYDLGVTMIQKIIRDGRKEEQIY